MTEVGKKYGAIILGLLSLAIAALLIAYIVSNPFFGSKTAGVPPQETYVNSVFGVSLDFPSAWIAGGTHPLSSKATAYTGGDGFFAIDIASSAMDKAVSDIELSGAYGTTAKVEKVALGGEPSYIILPSGDQPIGDKGSAAAVIPYPRPTKLAGADYSLLILYADVGHRIDICVFTVVFK